MMIYRVLAFTVFFLGCCFLLAFTVGFAMDWISSRMENRPR